jgi:hypothetical protein
MIRHRLDIGRSEKVEDLFVYFMNTTMKKLSTVNQLRKNGDFINVHTRSFLSAYEK